MQYGIAIRNGCVRTEPTMEPLRKYEGDVWDRRQESRLLVGEPVQVKRMADGWLYVLSEATEGYVRERDVFVCTKRHYERYRELIKKEFQVVLSPGRYKDGQYFRVGTVLPVFSEDYRSIPAERERRTERLRQVKTPAPLLLRGYLPFTERQMLLQMGRMLGIPYSWGDERGDGMDCSSTVRGFFACFGVTLPRNSEAQRLRGEHMAAEGRARYEKLVGLPAEEKTEMIRRLGIGTLLHMPGHVMLYAGERDGIPLIFHNIDTYREAGEEHIVRSCIISPFLPKGEGTYLDYLTAAWKPVK